MSLNLGSIYTEFRLKLDALSRDITSATSQLKVGTQQMEQAAGKASKEVSKSMGDIGAQLTKGLTLPLLLIGGAAVQAAYEIEKAMNIIRVGTGATGQDLAALGKDFEAVFKQVPASAERVATAIADLNTRTGLTGEALQKLARQSVELANTTGGDLAAQIAAVTRVFGDWSIEAERMTDAQDYLFKVSQATGATIEQLSQRIVQYGAPLRQMGFDFEQAAVMLGKFEKEGVNVELVLGSLRIALTRMASEGINDPAEALQVLIQRIKEAGSAGEANVLSMETFGARAGPDMAAAIREGRFEIEELLDAIKGSDETILKAAEDTRTLGESLEIVKNQAILALDPLGKVILDAFKAMLPLLEGMVKVLEFLGKAFGVLPGPVKTATVAMGLFMALLGPTMWALRFLRAELILIQGAFLALPGVLTRITGMLAGMGPMLATVGSTLVWFAMFAVGTLMNAVAALGPVIAALSGPIGWAIVAIAALVAAGYLLVKNWDEVKEALGVIWDAIKQTVQAVWPGIIEFFTVTIPQALDTLKDKLSAFPEQVKAALQRLATEGPYIIGFAIGSMVRIVIDGVTEIIAWFKGLPGRVKDSLNNLKARAVETWVQIKTSMVEAAKSTVEETLKWFSELPGKVMNFLRELPRNIRSAGIEMVAAARQAGTEVVNGIITTIRELPEKVAEVFRSCVDRIKRIIPDMFAAGREAGNKLWQGFKDGMGIKSPSYIEKALANIVEASRDTVKSLSTDFNRISAMTVTPNVMPVLASGDSSPSRQIVEHRFETLKIEGVNSQGQMMGIVEVVLDELRREVRL